MSTVAHVHVYCVSCLFLLKEMKILDLQKGPDAYA